MKNEEEFVEFTFHQLGINLIFVAYQINITKNNFIERRNNKNSNSYL